MRLDRLLSNAGLGSRSEVKAFIKSGRVTVNGAVCRDGGKNVEAGQVLFDGKPVTMAGHIVIVMNKPSGFLTAAEDKRQRTVAELLPEEMRGDLMPVGRLDKDTTGALLFTDDGQLAHRLISPKWHVRKVYTAQLRDRAQPGYIEQFASGIQLKDFKTAPAELTITGDKTCEVVLTEGKYHQVKRMFLAVGNEVVALRRESFAGIAAGDLEKGDIRRLNDSETEGLYRLCGMRKDDE